jgi:hypothetical protein
LSFSTFSATKEMATKRESYTRVSTKIRKKNPNCQKDRKQQQLNRRNNPVKTVDSGAVGAV